MSQQSNQERNNSASHRSLLPCVITAAGHLKISVPSEEIQVSPIGVRLFSAASTVLAAGGIASLAAIIFSGYFPPHP